MRVLFVTGTDTGVGKTVVTAALTVLHRARRESVAVVKPAQTGVGPDEPGDLAEVRRLAGEVPVHEGVRLPDPLAPDTAARVAGLPLPSLDDQRNLVDRVAREHDLTVVEGAGGLLVHLGVHWDLLDLAESVAYAGHPVSLVVVARAGLGTLNHAALTVQAIQRRSLEVDGVVVGAWPQAPGLAEEQNLLDLPLMTGVPVIGRVPAGAGGLSPEDFERDAPGWFAGS